MTDQERIWLEANQQYLAAELGRVRAYLERHIAVANDTAAAQREYTRPVDLAVVPDHLRPFALERVCGLFGLSAFDREILLLCAGVELQSEFGGLCAAAQGNPNCAYPTFSLALAVIPGAHWSALLPAAPLRHWRLIELLPGITLTQSPLHIDERILHYLVGLNGMDERLAGLVEPLTVQDELVPSHSILAERIATLWVSTAPSAAPRAVQLCGRSAASKQAIAAAASARAGLTAWRLSGHALPLDSTETDSLLRLWNREALLGGRALLLDCDDLGIDESRRHAIAKVVEGVDGPLVVTSRDPSSFPRRSFLTLDVVRPTSPEQRALWHSAWRGMPNLNGRLDALIAQFGLDAESIRSVADLARVELEAAGEESQELNDRTGQVLWNICRAHSRLKLEDLAQRIQPSAQWDDLVLPESQKEILREIEAHVRQRTRVYEQWGLAAKSARGLGISALFVGASGTGKTMAAEVLAAELESDLFRIDLSQVVSKYIGETEKNLRRVFDAADESGAVILFDEADAIFGKRSEVKDSHDRYANIEISYLLQRMEAYRGLAILTTNMKSALDAAFMRRIRFVVQFPFPDAGQRRVIWQRIFPVETPTEGLDGARLSQLNVAGGSIRNIALNAAFLAADAGERVMMKHLLRASKSEYAKLDKPLTEAETAGWV
jgi:ATP-dependent 26S proteasome regulatory subunit